MTTTRTRRPAHDGLSHGDSPHGDYLDTAGKQEMAVGSVMEEFLARLEVLLERHEEGVARRIAVATAAIDTRKKRATKKR